jgi:oligo-1,6-glucosidase
MIALRSRTPALVYGDYKDLDPDNPDIFAYTRVLGGSRHLVVLNFSKKPVAYTIPDGIKTRRLEITNLGSKEENTSALNLKPWEARVYTF